MCGIIKPVNELCCVSKQVMSILIFLVSLHDGKTMYKLLYAYSIYKNLRSHENLVTTATTRD